MKQILFIVATIVLAGLAACGHRDTNLIDGGSYTIELPEGWTAEAIGDSAIAWGHTLTSPNRRSTVTVCVFGIELEPLHALESACALGLTALPSDRPLTPCSFLKHDAVKASFSDGRTAGSFYAFNDGGSTIVLTSRHLLNIPDDLSRVAATLTVDGRRAHLPRQALTRYISTLIDHANTHYPQQPEKGITLLGYRLAPDSSAIIADIRMDEVTLDEVDPAVVEQSTREMQADVAERTRDLLYTDPLIIVARADSLALRYRYLTRHHEEITTFDIDLR